MGRLKATAPRLKPGTPRLGPAPGGDRDARRRAEQAQRGWYSSAAWQRLRWQCLHRDLFTCRFCGLVAADTSQLVGDHIVPPRGNRAMFFDAGNVQTLCKRCHDGEKQRQERRAYG